MPFECHLVDERATRQRAGEIGSRMAAKMGRQAVAQIETVYVCLKRTREYAVARNARNKYEKCSGAVYWKEEMAGDEPNWHAVLLEPDTLDVIP